MKSDQSKGSLDLGLGRWRPADLAHEDAKKRSAESGFPARAYLDHGAEFGAHRVREDCKWDRDFNWFDMAAY